MGAIASMLAAICTHVLGAEPVAVRHSEGIVHGFLVLRTLDGDSIADGELVQTARGDRVTSRLSFRFKDGSAHEETAVFTQRQQFRLVSDHLVQKGPSFARSLDMTIDAPSGKVGALQCDVLHHIICLRQDMRFREIRE